MLVEKLEGEHVNYYNICSQCNRRWFNKELSQGPTVSTIKLRIEEIKATFKRR